MRRSDRTMGRPSYAHDASACINPSTNMTSRRATQRQSTHRMFGRENGTLARFVSSAIESDGLVCTFRTLKTQPAAHNLHAPFQAPAMSSAS